MVRTYVEAYDGDNPVLSRFLEFLVADIARHPDRLQAVDADLVHRLQSLVGCVEIDLDADLISTTETGMD